MSVTPLAQPPESRFRPANWQLLQRFWHPVAFTAEIVDRPYPFKLLDLGLIAYRTPAGFTVALDRCPHRGASFALGWIEKDKLVCGYHGLQYDDAGRCVAIPSAGPAAKIPSRLCLRIFRSEVRHSILWVSLTDEPLFPLPDWRRLADPSLQKANMTPSDWNCSAARHIENFNDVAHFSWIHAGTFGSQDHPLTPRCRVVPTAAGFLSSIQVKQVDRDTFRDAPISIAEMTYHYDFTFPFSSYLKITSPDGRNEHIFDTIRPISAEISRVFIVKSRDYDLDRPVEQWISFQEAVNAEDKRMVESQRPQDLPLELGTEVHIGSDVWSIAYRRRRKSLGLK